MPEGDMVWRTARRLDRALAGRRLTASDFRVPQLATVDLGGGTVEGTITRGKHLLTRVEHEGRSWTVHTHLKMEGAWRIVDAGRRWPQPAHLARLVLATAERSAVGFQLGIVELWPRESEQSSLAHLGPDLLGVDWDEEEAVRRLRTHPDAALFDALRDQTSLAGLGTIWAAETCFTMGLHPGRPIAEVPDLVRTVRVARLKLQQSIRAAAPPPMAVYGRERAACRRCGTPIRSIPLDAEGRPRTAYFCPHCQR